MGVDSNLKTVYDYYICRLPPLDTMINSHELLITEKMNLIKIFKKVVRPDYGNIIYGSRYSRMDQVKLVEDSL